MAAAMNILCMLVTRARSQLSMSPLNDELSNICSQLVMSDTFHAAMCPYVAVASDSSVSQRLTASTLFESVIGATHAAQHPPPGRWNVCNPEPCARARGRVKAQRGRERWCVCVFRTAFHQVEVMNGRHHGRLPATEVSVEREGVIEHFAHRADTGHVPSAQVGVEGEGVIEHCVHPATSRNFPIPQVCVEVFGGAKRVREAVDL